MRIFEGQMKRLKVGHEVEDFPLGDMGFLSDFRGSLIFLVFWKTL